MHTVHKPTKRCLRQTGNAVLAPAMLAGLMSLALPALGHEAARHVTEATFPCTTAGVLGEGQRQVLEPPFDAAEPFAALQKTDLWQNVLSHLRMNLDKANPCFGFSDQDSWTKVVDKIPADVVAVQISEDGKDALVYVSGIPDYQMEMPEVFSSFKPGETYGIYRISSEPAEDERAVHDLSDRGTVGIFVNGVSIFNYTDTFSYADKGLWSYDANVAEALIVNSDISHATPSNLPQFPTSRGIYHNHRVSNLLLHQLQDPFVAGRLEHSRLLGFAMDSNPIYGPIGYGSTDQSSGLKVLTSSYVPRRWLTEQGTGHRSSLPGWAVINWDGSQVSGSQLLNLFQLNKADVLYRDDASEGPVVYAGTDERLAAEIAALQASVGLQRDEQGYVYWEGRVAMPDGTSATTRNYLIGSSELWGPDFDAQILPASYQIADVDKFYFEARLGSFAEDYEYVAGYGDLDFYNGISSYLPDRGAHAYHYVTPFAATVDDENRLSAASFPYVVGIQYKSRTDAFNDTIENEERIAYFAEHADDLATLFDLGVTGRDEAGSNLSGAVTTLWQQKLHGD